MKKRKHIILPLILAMILAIGLIGSGCAKNDQTTAKLSGKLVVYSTHDEAMLQKLADGFKEKTGVEVEFINLKGELADRVRAEKDNPQADIMYGGSSSLFITLDNEGLFEKVNTTWSKDLKDSFKGANGTWYGTIQTPVVIFYNTEMLTAAEAPAGWEDLADPKFENQIVSRDAVSSSQRATIVSLISYFSQKNDMNYAETYLKNLDKNTKNYYGSGSTQFEVVGKKEAAISYSTLNTVNDNIVKNSMPLEVVDAKEGSIVITDCAAVIKGAPNMENAKAFLEYVGSAETQVMIANDFDRMPTLDSAIAQGKDWMKKPLNAMDINWTAIAENESAWLTNWDTTIRNSSKDN